MLAFRLPIEMEKRLRDLSENTGRTITFYMKEALTDYLEDLEDWHLAEKVSIDVNNGKEETYSHEEMKKRYGLEN